MDTQQGLFKDEYVLLQGIYEDFDRRSLQIKGWISGGAIAGIGLALGKDHYNEILVVVAFVSLCIWYIEARWKLFQQGFRDRIRAIEAMFRNDQDAPAIVPLQIYHSWYQSYVEGKPLYDSESAASHRSKILRLLCAMGLDFVFVPYLPIIAICAILYVKNSQCSLTNGAVGCHLLLGLLGAIGLVIVLGFGYFLHERSLAQKQ